MGWRGSSRMRCLVINLARAKDRLAAAMAQFRDAGINLERLDAVDARLLAKAEMDAAVRRFRFYVANARRIRPCEIACALSHMKCWREAFKDGTPVAAVFEDDITILDPKGLHDALEAIEHENDPDVPTVWLLHRGIPRGRDMSGRWYDLLAADDVGRSWCAAAYALNAAAGKRLAEILTPIVNVSDSWSTFARCGVRVLVATKPCAGFPKQVVFASTIERRPGGMWRFAWFRRFYWWRVRVCFWIDLALKRLEGKRTGLA